MTSSPATRAGASGRVQRRSDDMRNLQAPAGAGSTPARRAAQIGAKLLPASLAPRSGVVNPVLAAGSGALLQLVVTPAREPLRDGAWGRRAGAKSVELTAWVCSGSVSAKVSLVTASSRGGRGRASESGKPKGFGWLNAINGAMGWVAFAPLSRFAVRACRVAISSCLPADQASR